MSDNDHEHRAYQVWDGDTRWAATDDVRRLQERVAELGMELDRLETMLIEIHTRLHDHEQAVPHTASQAW